MFLCVVFKFTYSIKIKIPTICYFETTLFQGNSKAYINCWFCINLDIKSVLSNQTACGAIILIFPRPFSQTWRSVYIAYGLDKSPLDAVTFSKCMSS